MEGCFMFQWGGVVFQMGGFIFKVGGAPWGASVLVGGFEMGGGVPPPPPFRAHNDKAILNLPYLLFYNVYSRP